MWKFAFLLIAAITATKAAQAYDSPVQMAAKPFNQCLETLVKEHMPIETAPPRNAPAAVVIEAAFQTCKERYAQPIYLMNVIEFDEWRAERITDQMLNTVKMQIFEEYGIPYSFTDPISGARCHRDGKGNGSCTAQ